jgi:hypothetical protein
LIGEWSPLAERLGSPMRKHAALQCKQWKNRVILFSSPKKQHTELMKSARVKPLLGFTQKEWSS